jgi:hypothetical protein
VSGLEEAREWLTAGLHPRGAKRPELLGCQTRNEGAAKPRPEAYQPLPSHTSERKALLRQLKSRMNSRHATCSVCRPWQRGKPVNSLDVGIGLTSPLGRLVRAVVFSWCDIATVTTLVALLLGATSVATVLASNAGVNLASLRLVLRSSEQRPPAPAVSLV